jgi:hypothetical protein
MFVDSLPFRGPIRPLRLADIEHSQLGDVGANASKGSSFASVKGPALDFVR